MKKNYLLLLLCVLFCACTSQSDVTVEKPEIRFKDGKLRIAQFTDVHWDTGESAKGSDEHLPKTIKNIVESENPDILVFTGDVVTGYPLVEGWRVFSSAAFWDSKAFMPWASLKPRFLCMG